VRLGSPAVPPVEEWLPKVWQGLLMMVDESLRTPFAHYPPRPGATRLHLRGGPLDGWEVGIEEPAPSTIRVNGPRHGNHTIWVTHEYIRRAGRYEYLATEQYEIRTFC
jgi:hypothetical protein